MAIEEQVINDEELLDKLGHARESLLREIRKAIIGQDDVVEQVLLSLFVGGHSIMSFNYTTENIHYFYSYRTFIASSNGKIKESTTWIWHHLCNQIPRFGQSMRFKIVQSVGNCLLRDERCSSRAC